MATEVLEIGDDGEISILYTTPIGFKSAAAKISIDLTEDEDVETLPSSSKRRRLPKVELADDTILRLSFTCAICSGVKPMSDSFLITGCGHSYCTPCISNYVAAKVVQDNVATTINCPAPGCGGLLEPHQCRTILPKEVLDRWGAEKLHPGIVLCGIDVKEFEKVSADEDMNKMVARFRCRRGKLNISKSGGCYFISCRCGYWWCYHCKAPVGYGRPHRRRCQFYI